jgi:hypothetical protein
MVRRDSLPRMTEKSSMTMQPSQPGYAVIQPPADGSHLLAHDLIYQGELPDWMGGIPLGDGETAVIAYQAGCALSYGIMKAGFADTRNPLRYDGRTHADIMELWRNRRIGELAAWDNRENAHYHNHPYPCPRTVGVLSLCSPGLGNAGHDRPSHVLSLRDAVLVQRTPELDTTVFVQREQDCLCLQVTPHAPLILKFSPRIQYPGKGTKWWDQTGDIDAEIRCDMAMTADGFTARVELPGGKIACAACRVQGATLRGEVGQGAALQPDQPDTPIHIYLAVTTHLDGDGFAMLAETRAAFAAARVWADMLAPHRADWHRFWAVNGLLLEDKFLEQLFYLEQYLLRGQHGGSHVYSGINAWWLGTHPWHGDMHTNINVEMAWLPVFPLNRAELADACADHFAGHLEDARKETAEFWQTPGVAFPFASVGDLRALHGGFWRYETYVSAWVAQIFWERYRYTGDVPYLREVCYPVLREVLQFYAGLMEFRADGTCGLPVGKPVESQRPPDGAPFVKDTLLDLIALRQCLTAGIEASEKLDMDAGLREQWRSILTHLAPWPCDRQRGLFTAFRDADPDLPNDHPTLLGALFPSGLPLSPQELVYTEGAFDHILRTSKRVMPGFPFKNILAWGDDLSYSWLAIAAARLGKRDKVLAYLYDFLVLLQLKKNGLFASRPSDVATRDGKIALINTCGGFVMAMTEMFLQSYDGTLRVFPATPPDYTAAFSGLRAVGDFTVAAAQVEGRLCYISIRSGRGNTLTLRNDWGRMDIHEPGGSVKSTEEAIITIPTVQGKSYLLMSAGQPREAFPLTWDTPPRSTPRTWTGPAFLERPPTGEGWTISIGQPETSTS